MGSRFQAREDVMSVYIFTALLCCVFTVLNPRVVVACLPPPPIPGTVPFAVLLDAEIIPPVVQALANCCFLSVRRLVELLLASHRVEEVFLLPQ